MHPRTCTVLGIIAVVLFALVLTASADNEKIIVPKKIQDAVNKMADDIGKDKKVDWDASVFVNAHHAELKQTMWIFKPRMKDEGGFGVGSKPGPYKLGDRELPDGIEGIIITLANPRRAALKAEDLKKAAPDLKRLADITQAMAEITRQYKPIKKVDMDPKNWFKFADEMKQGAKDLKAAVEMNKPDATKAAFTKLYASCTGCHAIFRDGVEFVAPQKSFLFNGVEFAAPQKSFVVPQTIQDSLNAMADAVGKDEKIDKEADAFFKDRKGDFKTAKWLFEARAADGTGGFGIGPKPDRYEPDEIAGYVTLQGGPRAKALLEPQLKAAAADLNRLADVVIAMAEVTQRYKPKNIVIGGPVIAKPADWTASANDMKQAALDLKAAVKANKPNNVKTSFTKLNASCVKCHSLFR